MLDDQARFAAHRGDRDTACAIVGASLRSVQRPHHSKLIVEFRESLDSTLEGLVRHAVFARLGPR